MCFVIIEDWTRSRDQNKMHIHRSKDPQNRQTVGQTDTYYYYNIREQKTVIRNIRTIKHAYIHTYTYIYVLLLLLLVRTT